MNVLKRLKNLEAAVRRLEPRPGPGVRIVSTPLGGTVYSAAAEAPAGMFAVVEGSDPGTVLVTDTGSEEEEPEFCGVAHVNNQPFQVKAAELAVKATRRVQYVYFKFTAPKEADATAAAVPAKAEVAIEEEPRDSDWGTVWHLLARVTATLEDGKVASVSIEQDHPPGNLYAVWFGPCLGLLDEQPMR